MTLHATPVPDAAETRANATFEALMWALSRPGTVQHLPQSGAWAIAEALVDRECRAFTDDPALAPQLVALGAALVVPAQADHAFVSLGTPAGVRTLAQLPAGSALYPDEGATVVAEVRLGTGQRLRLTGPGIESTAEIAVDGIDPGFWAARAARCRYPEGIDLFLICGTAVIGLPRSTRIEVL
ncbi:phosphonate C-P lyase system protein PhnH [Pontitalea aquivivens]|uniref:phosphonate C-P lyase system protein PhnH n=1 Tax=Pontitalea aquivivens TaxID=3388663 RepID=UPI003970C0A3